ncbi:FecR family protein [Chitinophaga barathri]|uniref:DUF4974 domain-containing protein n=1 Tax=Chitinophaga barathri TaxID=1647451 RepID=A0A3N4MGM5_9BACT|nr:FecR family protein [Chitinophaga barathri]RPD43114.1 DUF4974 domain-containing protein [Chitinophaga barathri]
MEDTSAIEALIARQMLGQQLTPDEEGLLRQWQSAHPLHKRFYKDLTSKDVLHSYKEVLEVRRENYAAIMSRIGKQGKVRKIRWSLLIAACSLALLITSFALLFWRQNIAHTSNSLMADKAAMTVPVKPAGSRATLILGDGRKIPLDSGASLALTANGVAVRSITGTQLQYTDELTTGDYSATHTLVTPRSGVFQVTLSDGTLVWLNADSRLIYPTRFADARKVELQGEAYFEVAKDHHRPFQVTILGFNGEKPTTVDVLGTHFNVKAYPGVGDIRTTLLEGAVRVRHGDSDKVLKPGQQASVKRSRSNDDIEVKQVPTQDAIDWRDGFFRADNIPVAEIIGEVGRWYDVTFLWETPVPEINMMLIIGRNEGIDQTLRLLEQSDIGLRFERDGRHIHVLKN